MSIRDDIAAARNREPGKSDPINFNVGGSLYEIVFTEAPGKVWAEVASRNPPRLNDPIDRIYGYNYQGIVPEIAETTATLTKDSEPVVMVVEPWSKANPNPVNDWRDLFEVIEGTAQKQIADAVFQLNQWGPDQRVAALKKASRPASELS